MSEAGMSEAGMSEAAMSEDNGNAVESEEIMAVAMGEGHLNADGDRLSEAEERLFDLVIFLVQGIVSKPDEVEVEEFLDDVGSVYAVRVHADDVGRVIGKEGRVANALRQVVKAAATKTGTRVAVEIVTDDNSIEIVGSDDPEIEDGTEAA